MIMNRSDLIDKLKALFTKYGIKKQVKQDIVDYIYYELRAMSDSRAVGIINGSIPTDSATDYELYCLSKAFNHVLKSDSDVINIDNIFTKLEIEEFEKIKLELEEEPEVYTLVLHNVDMVKEGHFFCTKESYQGVANLINKGFLTYNFATQRERTRRIFNGELIEEPTVNKLAVAEMKDLMIDGLFYSNAISYNIRKLTGKEDFHYNPQERRITIKIDNKSTILDTPDGWHRELSMLKAVEEKPNLDGTTMIHIFHKTEEEMKAFIEQESKRTVINKDYLKTLQSRNEWMTIAKSINTFGNEKSNVLFGKLAEDEVDKEVGNKYVRLSIFADAIKDGFEKYYNDPFDLEQIKSFIVKGFNGVFKFSKNKAKNNNLVFSENMFVGYVALLGELYESEDFVAALQLALDDIDFSEDNSVWSDLKITNKNLNFKNRKRIAEYFVQKARQIVA